MTRLTSLFANIKRFRKRLFGNMDELMFLNYLEEMEAAEDAFGNHQENAVQHLAEDVRNLSNEQFKKIFRLTREAFQYLEEMLQPHLKQQIKHTDISPSLKILVALRFYATGSYQMDIGANKFFAVSQSSVSRCITEVTDALNLPEVFNRFVHFPRNFPELNEKRLRFYQKHAIPGVVGCIDCTQIAIFPPKIDDPEYPEHLYVNRKGYHSINVQLICDADLKILNVNARYPGSTHDSHVWNNSRVQTLLRNLHDRRGYKDYYLLGDSGYPLRTWLLTPFTNAPLPNTPEHHYNIIHKSTRSLIERCNGVLKTRFRCCLKHRVLLYSPQRACTIINACVILHNICIQFQIPPDEEAGEEVDYGMFHNYHDNGDIQVRQVNPELADGRQAQTRLARNLFL